MKVYFACSSKNIDKYIGNYLLIKNHILNSGHTLTSDWLNTVKSKIDFGIFTRNFKVNKQAIRMSGIKSIKKADALVADVSLASGSVGYQIALALTQRIPVLCLYSLDFGIKKAPQVVISSDAKLLTISAYSKNNYKEVLNKFFNKQIKNELLKFNFIISKEIEDYLEWVSDKTNKSKSQILREKIIKKIIKSDQEYSTYLKSQAA